MTSTLKVDQIQNSSGTSGLSIDSNGDVTFSGANTVTPVDSGWITATLNSGYTHYASPYGPVKYRKIGSTVNIQGITNEATAGTVFTLPSGWAPDRQILVATQNQNGLGRCDIKTNGDVTINNSNSGWFSFTCTFFTA